MMTERFPTPKMYTDRVTKAEFVFQKYKSILQGSVLDIGADQGYLRKHLGPQVEYTGVVKDPAPGLVAVDLECGKLPFADKSFDAVLCLDVLEHLDSIHSVFDELCRVSKNYVVISLPNPWRTFIGFLEGGAYRPDQRIKFYGLPKEKPEDRHKWFFSSKEGREFVSYRAELNKMALVDTYVEDNEFTGVMRENSQTGLTTIKAREHLFRADMPWAEAYEGTQWYVLQKSNK
jgi:SAM-dependent methyltransferase